ncbi:hypothetical protein AJ85_14315 [Alkalihalobacillus alcalophilus ATCC 27647 = CGMCC 1.3604]|uniref:Uncharacterized protein n=1 Tax=Alkalihalobacillus alcalophilus ATCC 27647 = CGMCC 1.3604 TaxID=1218173 RepID=A0A094WQI8_ALKAL|nr:hypothetical protein [Alkalihalobacillus alcalophilus]KGA98268.1 hypothetical protein BALCAV_0204970 [Alkalihalobacillus alcalophilus ATCC 27647 = CGMCC 1.3604]MED1561584.1 hypothetical protein [Alkalihalobacillus alcalophilus]THG89867.1 hypothetical protein AJ85_14315 [Alkalihalobacillus alcalophilus ATCC 27647 = CGMCC 1.3604]
MLGFLLTSKEVQEVEYLLKRELEEILLDLTDPRIDNVVKGAMVEKYDIVYGIYKRFVSPADRIKYALPRAKREYQ